MENFTKYVASQLLNFIRRDCRSITGANLRKIHLLTGESSILDMKRKVKLIPFELIPKEDSWRSDVVNEITDAKLGVLSIDGFTTEELNEVLQFVCTS